MDISLVSSTTREHVGKIILWGLLIGSLSFLFSIALTKRYRVTTDFLIAQNAISFRDLYSLSKSAEYAGNVLSDAIYSELFFKEVLRTDLVNLHLFPTDANARLHAWKETLRVRKNFQSSILTVEVFDDKKANALRLAQAIAKVLTEQNYVFRTGTPDSLTLKVLSGPIAEKNPSVTTVVGIGVAGMIAGMAAAIFRFLLPELVRRNLADRSMQTLTPLVEFEDASPV